MSLRDILETENIIKITPQENLSSALSKLKTSHDAAFMFNDDNKLLGVINPYYCLIKSSYPGNAKAEHCLYHVPKVYINYSIAKMAGLFIHSKVHYLPVFDKEDKFVGIVSARQLLFHFQTLPIFFVKIKDVLKTKKNPLAVVYENDTIATAINVFKMTKYSKLIVVDKEQRLKGILSYYDLISYLITPKTSPGRGEKEGDKMNFHQYKVKNFSKKYVLTLSPDQTLNEAVRLITTKHIGSVVIIDKKHRPVGIITTKDLLKFFIRKEQIGNIVVISKNLSLQSRHIFGGFFNHFSLWFKRFPDLAKARLFIKEEKGKNLFTVALSLFPKKGKPRIIKKEGNNLLQVLSPITSAVRAITNRK